MRKSVEWLMEQYIHEIEGIEQDIKEEGFNYKGALKASIYKKVVTDLKEILDEK